MRINPRVRPIPVLQHRGVRLRPPCRDDRQDRAPTKATLSCRVLPALSIDNHWHPLLAPRGVSWIRVYPPIVAGTSRVKIRRGTTGPLILNRTIIALN